MSSHDADHDVDARADTSAAASSTTSTARWQRLEAMLQEALDRPPEAVEALLAEASAEDPSLARELRALLRASRQLSFLDSPALLTTPQGLDASQDIGGFAIEHEIGRGGMGVVYYATDRETPAREAAIKVLTPPTGSPTWEARFHREREILARLDHPNIPRLLDGGQTPGPILVMEYVEGQRIDHDCEHHRRTIEERLLLFIAICEAVHHAHQNLVIHCDIKPANILVDPQGVPKLLDFGIAKLHDQATGKPGDDTRTLARPLTPDYASPEVLFGQTPTTASDVYSLGVVLYELLCGQVPHRLAGRSVDVARRLLSEDPPLPSRVVEARAERQHHPVRCGLPPTALARRLRGNLDRIVRKALQFEPHHRYASAAELAQDIQQHLEGKPIRARAEPLRATVWRLLRRHRLASSVAALVLVSILAFGVAMAWQNARILHAHSRAEHSYQTSRAVGDFLVSLYTESEKLEQGEGSLSARQLADYGVEQLGDSLQNQPMTRAAVDQALGQLYFNLGEYPQALQRLESSLAIRRSYGKPKLVADSLHQLGRVHHAAERYSQARATLKEALKLRRDEGDRPGMAATLLELARVDSTLGRPEEAETALMHSLALRRHVFGERSIQMAAGLHALSQLYRETHRTTAAETLMEQVLEIRAEHLGTDQLRVGATANTLGQIYQSQSEFAPAVVALDRSVSIYQQMRGPEHLSVAAPKHNLAILYGTTGELDRARELFEEVLAMRLAAHEGPHTSIALTLFGLASVLDLQGEHARAIEVYGRAAAAYEALYGAEHPAVGNVLANLGQLYLDQGELDLAERSLERAFDIYRDKLPRDDPARSACEARLGEVAYFRGQTGIARSLTRRAIADLREISDTLPSLAPALRRMGRIELDQGDLDDARPWFEQALEIRRQTLPRLHPERLRSTIDWADWLVASARYTEAESLLRDLVDATAGADEPARAPTLRVAEAASARVRLGRVLQRLGRAGEGRQWLETAVTQLLAITPRTLEGEHDLLLALVALGRTQEAARLEDSLRDRGIQVQGFEPQVAASTTF